MITFLANWKLYLILLIVFSFLLNIMLYNRLQVYKAKIQTLQVGIDLANQLKTEQERKLKLTEQEAANARAESQKRTELIMAETVNGGCEGAIQYGIKQASIMLFYWPNNIP